MADVWLQDRWKYGLSELEKDKILYAVFSCILIL